MTPPKEAPKIARKKIAYEGYFDVHVDLLETACGKKMDYTSLDLKVHAAAVLARTVDRKLILTKEYRHPTNQWIWGCPGGRIDLGESPLEAALRELQEEAGYTGKNPRIIGEVFPLPAVTGQVIHYVFVDEAIPSHKMEHEPFEFIRIEPTSFTDLTKALSRGDPIDGVLCTALFLARDLFI